ncbi:uncharacterized protein BDZ83DRAFT_40783 [Colletotrichum acutatum]|uniref:Secreted protein n=1 Tax=Glomerella acutata TaxID=27357 RepID=A0AAD8XEF9_GLOAC|nr:uncharacterized protein BDZ83DRAFT_40783 [Colletotrichum acutatum]KAK1716725.1 hypothetical protein BDZ83DRAFT_40783 [Colletotrichum acutatum]
MRPGIPVQRPHQVVTRLLSLACSLCISSILESPGLASGTHTWPMDYARTAQGDKTPRDAATTHHTDHILFDTTPPRPYHPCLVDVRLFQVSLSTTSSLFRGSPASPCQNDTQFLPQAWMLQPQATLTANQPQPVPRSARLPLRATQTCSILLQTAKTYAPHASNQRSVAATTKPGSRRAAPRRA